MSSPEAQQAAREWQMERLQAGGNDSERAGAETIGGKLIDRRLYHEDGTPLSKRERFGRGSYWGQPTISVCEIDGKLYLRADGGVRFPSGLSGLNDIAQTVVDQVDPGFSDPARERERIDGIIQELLA